MEILTWFSEFDALEKTFLVLALLGSVLFLVRLLMVVFGGNGDADVDMDVGGDVGGAGMESQHDFRILSLQSLTGFFMMFGLVGLAMNRSFHIPALSVSGGIVAGLGTMWILDRAFRLVRTLQSTGNLQVHRAVGQEGTVYLKIPEKGAGKVQLTVHGRLREFSAISKDHVELQTGERVIVDAILDGNVLSVRKSAVELDNS